MFDELYAKVIEKHPVVEAVDYRHTLKYKEIYDRREEEPPEK